MDCSGAAAADNGMGEDEDDEEDAVPAVRLGEAEREASQSAGHSLTQSTSGQYDSTGLSNEGQLRTVHWLMPNMSAEDARHDHLILIQGSDQVCTALAWHVQTAVLPC